MVQRDDGRTLDYEALSDSDRRRLKLLSPDRSSIGTLVILLAIIFSGVVSVALAAMGALILLRTLIGS